MTAAEDGTLRIWDTETATQRTVVKPTVGRPGRVAVTACAYGDDGALLAAGLNSGVLQLWDVRGAPVPEAGSARLAGTACHCQRRPRQGSQSLFCVSTMWVGRAPSLPGCAWHAEPLHGPQGAGSDTRPTFSIAAVKAGK